MVIKWGKTDGKWSLQSKYDNFVKKGAVLSEEERASRDLGLGPDSGPTRPSRQQWGGKEVAKASHAMGFKNLTDDETSQWKEMYGKEPPSEIARQNNEPWGGVPYARKEGMSTKEAVESFEKISTTDPEDARDAKRRRAFDFYYGEEGGLGSDHYGRVYKGLSEKWHPDLWKEADALGLKHPTKEKVHERTMRDYWEPTGSDDLPSDTALVMLGFSANAGRDVDDGNKVNGWRSVYALQDTIGMPKTERDGLWGPNTKGYLEKYLASGGSDTKLAKGIAKAQRNHWASLIARNPTKYATYGPGWYNRYNHTISAITPSAPTRFARF